MRPRASTLVDVSPGMTAYGFHRGSAEGGRHHFGPERFGWFAAEAARRGLWDCVREVTSGAASDDELELFHSTLFLMTLRRAALGLPQYDPNKFGGSGDAKMIELEKLPIEKRREAIYGVAAD